MERWKLGSTCARRSGRSRKCIPVIPSNGAQQNSWSWGNSKTAKLVSSFLSSLHWQDRNHRVTASSKVFHPLTGNHFSYIRSHTLESENWSNNSAQIQLSNLQSLPVWNSVMFSTHWLSIPLISELWKVKNLFNSTPNAIMLLLVKVVNKHK